jgi:hypothetical protein
VLKGSIAGAEELLIATDAAFAVGTSRKSVSGIAIFLNGDNVAWKSQRQSTVTLSTSEAEVVAAATGMVMARKVLNLYQELCPETKLCITMLQDNSAAGKYLTSQGRSSRLKYLDVKYIALQEWVRDKKVKVLKVTTDQMPADILTKNLVGVKFKQGIQALGVLMERYKYWDNPFFEANSAQICESQEEDVWSSDDETVESSFDSSSDETDEGIYSSSTETVDLTTEDV